MKAVNTCVIVDDHLLIAKAITSIVEEFGDFQVLYECDGGHMLIEKMAFEQNIPAIILLDISMPEMDGFQVAGWLKENHPEVLVMALTSLADDESVVKMIKAGARGYMHKNVHPGELRKALLALVEKGYYYPDWATSKVLYNIANPRNHQQEETIQLTSKERMFLELSCTELTYKQMAYKMECSHRTIEGYRDALFEKLNVRTRVALALYAVKIGLHKL